MLSSLTGIIHFTASIIALLSGTIVLSNLKGTKRHVAVGYIYTGSMLVVLVTSFMIYRLHGTFGILHWLAVLSSATLLGGIVPIMLRRPANYMTWHFSFMYWSVIGLYCAFAAEVLTRLPFILGLEKNIAVIFYALVGVATFLVAGIGSFYFRRYKDRWAALVHNHK